MVRDADAVIEHLIRERIPSESWLIEPMKTVAKICWPEWVREAARKVTPVCHPLHIADLVLRVFPTVDSDPRFLLRGLVLALCHDTRATGRKIVSQEVKDLRERDKAAADRLEQQRIFGRFGHMFASSSVTVDIMDLVNQIHGKIFEMEDTVAIGLVTARHDFHSVGLPVPLVDTAVNDTPRLWSAFVDCDQLFQILYRVGPMAEVWRRNDEVTKTAVEKWLRKNIANLRGRRKIFPPNEQFCGDSVFRYLEAHKIYEESLRSWADEFDTTVEELTRAE